jgi:hypothetical protein
VHKDPQAHKVFKVLQVYKDLQVHKVFKEPQVQLEDLTLKSYTIMEDLLLEHQD